MKYVVPVLALLCMAVGTFFFFFVDDDGPQPTSTERDKPSVCSTLYPLHYFVQRIAGDLVDAELVVPAADDPLHWRPDAPAIQRLQRADLLVFNGAGAEKWAFSLALPQSRIIETADVLREDFITIGETLTHSHGPGGSHTHEGVDPHTWVDPVQALAQAEEVWKGLRRVLPDHHGALESNFRGLETDLEALHVRLSTLDKLTDGDVIVATLPAYNYLARRYGWQVIQLELDPARPPLDAEELAAVRAKLQTKRARFVLWATDPSPTPALAQQLGDELGARGLLFRTCETVPSAGGVDYLAAMEANVSGLERAFAEN